MNQEFKFKTAQNSKNLRLKGVLNSNFRPFSFELKKKIFLK